MNTILITTCFTLLLGSMILAKDLDLSNDDEFLVNLNLNKPVKTIFKMYLLNFTNPEEFFSDPNAKAKLKPVGPYSYIETWVNDEVKWVDDGKVEFVPKRIFRFEPDLSGGRQTDTVVSLNIPLIIALNSMKYGPEVARQGISSLVEILEQKLYDTYYVKEYIWGMKHPLIKLGRDVETDPKKRYPYEEFGLFVGKNFTNNGKATIATGLDDTGYLAQLLEWDNSESLGFWQPGSLCDKPHGSIGMFTKPNLTKRDKLHIFNRNFCKSFSLDFQKEVTSSNGINAYRFTPSLENYDRFKDNPDTECFCVNDSCKDLPAGLFNMTECQYGAPLFFSPPHFTRSDPSLLDQIEGLTPDDKYLTYLDFNPELGITTKFRVSGQISVQMTKAEGVKDAEGLRDMIFPLMYFVIDTEDDFIAPADINRLKEIIAKRSA